MASNLGARRLSRQTANLAASHGFQIIGTGMVRGSGFDRVWVQRSPQGWISGSSTIGWTRHSTAALALAHAVTL